MRRGKFAGIAGVMSLLVGGCQNVGPISIDAGRDRYNNVLQSTAKEQTLSNIIRAYNREPITYMDVTEVDAVTSLTGSVNGAVTNIGATATKSTTAGTLAGQVGGVGGSATYAETPTVRYIPLLGSGLVQQLATPVSTEAVESLYNSSWKVGPLLDLATFYQTFDFDYNAAAANITFLLSLKKWVSLVATKSDLTKSQDSLSGPLRQGPSGNITLQVTNKASSTGTKDSLTIYLRSWDSTYTLLQSIGRLRLWAALNYIYAGTQPGYTPHDINYCRNNLHLYETPAQKSKDRNSETPNQTTTTLTSRKVTTRSSERTPAETTTETTRQMTHETSVEPNTQADDQKPTQTPAALSKPALRALIQYLSHLSHTLRPVAETLSAAKSKPYQDYLNNVRKCLPESIELRTDTVSAEKAKDLISTSPLLKTYSALGILKHATGQGSPKFAFVSHDDYLKIREFPWNQSVVARGYDFYTLPPYFEEYLAKKNTDGEASNPDHHDEDRPVHKWLMRQANGSKSGADNADDGESTTSELGLLVYWPTGASISDKDFINGNTRLAELRRYILIITDSLPPTNAYVSHFERGIWYYIDGADLISQKNFELVSLFLTMMAVPSTTPQLTPTISVGGT